MLLALTACLAASTAAMALTISMPVQVHVSPDGNWIVRITHRREEPDAQSSVARWYRLDARAEYRLLVTAPLRNASAPVSAFVTNKGALVTLGDERDDLAEALVVYSPSGIHLKSWPLDSLLTSAEQACMLARIRGAEVSLTKFWRSEAALNYYVSNEVVSIWDALGGQIEVSSSDGSIKVDPTGRKAALESKQCRDKSPRQ